MNGHQLPLLTEGGESEGYVPLYRCLEQSPAFQSDGLWRLYTWCLWQASYTRRWLSVSTGRGTTEIELDRGQFVFGRHAAAAKLGMPAESVRTRMAKLAELGFISIAPTTHYSIITVCDYPTCGTDQEQSHHPNTTQTPTKHQPNTTNNKGKKDKKVNKQRAAAADFSVDDIQLPKTLDFPEVKASLAEWIQYKVENGQAYKNPKHLQKKVNSFESLGPHAFVAAVDHSIGSEYRGLFPAPNGSANGHGNAPRKAAAASVPAEPESRFTIPG